MPSRRVWRAAPATLAVVGLFCVAAGVCIPVLAYLVLLREQSPAVPIFLVVLAVFALGYGWRFGLHPSLRADEHGVVVNNPGRRVRFGWSEITVLAPGGNGLVVGSESDRAEAWCIQKSRWAARRGRRTRADRIVDELCELQDQYDPPLEDDETGIRIRRARWHEYGLLTRIERSASKAALGHVFPAAEYPYPTVAVRRRWRRLLRDRMIQIRILEHWEIERIETPVGLVAFETAGTIRHLAIVPRAVPPRLRLAAARVRDGGDLRQRRVRGPALGPGRQHRRPRLLPPSGLDGDRAARGSRISAAPGRTDDGPAEPDCPPPTLMTHRFGCASLSHPAPLRA